MKKIADADVSGHLLHPGSQTYGKSKTFLKKKKNQFKEVNFINITIWKKKFSFDCADESNPGSVTQ